MIRENERLAVEATMKNAGVYDLLYDNDLTEIMANPDGKLWVDRLGKGREFTGIIIPAEKREAVIITCASYCGELCHKKLPLLEADLIDFGYARFQGVLPPVTHAPAFSIRRKAILNYSLDELSEAKGMLTKDHVYIIRAAVIEKKNILIAGGTNTGKTTFANAILKEFADNERVITLEDTMELETSIIKDCFPLRTMNGTVTMDTLLRTALRLRPDRILLGEVRGKEAWSLLKALSSGHSGGLCTIHAFGGKSALTRLEQLALEASIKQIPKDLIGEVIDIIVHIEFDAKSGIRKIADITKVHGFDGKEYIVEKVG
ncbi:MAG: Flp pilus assembly complex ATPase component TadA [Desulfobacula sp.]|jgi:type IV secretion system protein TrbB|nr:Flp pilus assembly complex ATPase component TadA [Desulfobacula sp.]